MTLHHSVQGDGPSTVFFLHGFLGSGRNLGALQRRFNDRWPELRTVQVDLPGHGQSPPLAPRADLYSAARAVLDLADPLGAAVRIVGHSMGGRVGLAMLDLAPDRVTRVDLIDITPGTTHHLPVGDVVGPLLAAPDVAPDRRQLRQFFLDAGLSGPFSDWLLMNVERRDGAYRWRIDRAALAELHQRHGHTDLWSAVERHPRRIVAVRGGRSRYLGDEDAARLARLDIPVYVVEGAGHFVHAEAPDATFAALTALDPRDDAA